MSDLISVREAQQRILSRLKLVDSETIPLAACHGRILAEDVQSPLDLPAFPNSSMDGFAILAVDVKNAGPETPIQLEIVENIAAGRVTGVVLKPGQAARIMTGAMVPDGADCVVPVEDTNFSPDLLPNEKDLPLTGKVLIYRQVQAGAYIRPRGQDIRQGQSLLFSGRRLQPQDVGIMAAVGKYIVQVFRRPVVAVLSSGDELVQPGEPIGPGQIYDANQYVLAAMLEQAGASVLRLGTAPDDPIQINALLEYGIAHGADLIVTSAGVSVGAFDYVRQVIQSKGELDFWKVNMRPGKPLVFGQFAETPLIGLPGNPVSAYVGCQVFVLPAVRFLSGQSGDPDGRKKAVLAEPVESDGRESYLRAIVQEIDGRMEARLAGHQGSGNLFSLVQANALLIVPSGVKSLPSDSEVDFLPLHYG